MSFLRRSAPTSAPTLPHSAGAASVTPGPSGRRTDQGVEQRAETNLLDAPQRVALMLRRAEGEPDFCRRLSALGLRRGAQLRVVHGTVGGGRIIEVAGSRIALDRGVLQRLFAEPVAEPVA